MNFNPTDYSLINCSDGHIFEDSKWCLNDPQSNKPSLIRAIYSEKKFKPRNDLDGFYRYADWLPISRILSQSHPPVTFKSTSLANFIGLDNLYITFSGFWPEKGALMQTCSFKETEAYSVCARLPKDCDKILVVASAGNTARAFAKVCSDNNIPLLLSIPEDNISALWFKNALNKCVKIIAAPKGCDYFDAISLADTVCKDRHFLAEGGAKNIARRDGMGTTLLSAVETIGRIPDAYFQAIGSGTGAIAVWENNLRLIEDGSFGNHKMRLYPSQNSPFTLMYDSWKAHSRELVPMGADEARKKASEIEAKVLSNRKPPYSLAGGVFDALEDTNGDMFTVTNEELEFWAGKFLELEGIDIHPAAAVATASVAKALKEGAIKREEIIMLNITGGGEIRAKEGADIYYAKPDLILDPALPNDVIIEKVSELF